MEQNNRWFPCSVLQATCKHGLASLEEAQQRALEGVRLNHQVQLQLLVTERDQLLEEETAATVTGKRRQAL